MSDREFVRVPTPAELASASFTPADEWGQFFAENMRLGVMEGTFSSESGGRIFAVPADLQDLSIHSPLRTCPVNPLEDRDNITVALDASGWTLEDVKENRGEIPFNIPSRDRLFGYDLYVRPKSA